MSDRIESLADGVWVVKAPLRFMGLELGTRMTIVRAGDALIVHSPIAIDHDLKAAIDALGEVRFIVAPNVYHHVFAADAAKAWPSADLVAPAALRAKRPDLTIAADLDPSLTSAWGADVLPLPIRGCMLAETVLFHVPTKTLVSSDLFENFSHVDHWFTRQYLKAGGVYGKAGWHPLLRFVYRDKKIAKGDVEKLLELDMTRIIVAHGDVVQASPKETMRGALAFLLGAPGR